MLSKLTRLPGFLDFDFINCEYYIINKVIEFIFFFFASKEKIRIYSVINAFEALLQFCHKDETIRQLEMCIDETQDQYNECFTEVCRKLFM